MALLRQRSLSLRLLLAVSLITAAGSPGFAQLPDKHVDTFEHGVWQAGAYNKATGKPVRSTDVPDALRGESTSSMLQEVRFTEKGFEFYGGNPTAALVIPGETKKVTLWVKRQSEGDQHPWIMTFQDGWGRTEAEGRKFEWELTKGVGNGWQEVSFDVPGDWVQPITIVGLTTHNWSSQGKPTLARLWVDDLRVQTDVSNVDITTGKLALWKPGPNAADGKPTVEPVATLLSATLSTPVPYHVFVEAQPALRLQARSWVAEKQTGTLDWRLTDFRGAEVGKGTQNVEVSDLTELQLPLPAEKYGTYQLEATLQWTSGTKTETRLTLAKIPKPVTLTPEQKEASPYGLNVHGGRQRMVQTFADAGIVWFRDYAFNFDWMVRAKGDAKKYDGWPWYPQIVKDYEEAGVMLLACHGDAINLPGPGAPTDASAMRPDREWTRELVDMVLAFPSIRHHELDNEYDLGADAIRAETPIDWENYRNYHDQFGDVIDLVGAGELVAVENGRAGIWPDRVAREVDSGKFDHIQVINSHHYTGVDPPETNVTNNNTAGGGKSFETPRLFVDQLRDVSRAADGDGVDRQHWITEFGWDTKAGHVVSPLLQAAYLQRGYFLLHAAEVEKGFWFFDLDADGANQFFDGCGLFDNQLQPKLSYASFAAMTKLLPTPEYVGMIEAGGDTWGYLFRQGEDLVATMWTVEGESGPRVEFAGAKLYDFLANPIAGDTVTLSPTPVFAVGIGDDSPLYAQTAYSLDSAYLVAASAGDEVTIELRVTNNRAAAIAGEASVETPDGWTPVDARAFDVPTNDTEVVPLTFRVGPNEPVGEKLVTLRIRESGEVVKSIPIRVRVQPGVALAVTPLDGDPGVATVRIDLTNRSETQAMAGEVALQLPTGWASEPASFDVAPLSPTESRTLEAKVKWSVDFAPDESASVTFTSVDGRRVERPLMPGQIAVRRAPSLTADGDLADWPEQTRIPSWLLATASGLPNQVEVRLAWSAEGLHLAFAVDDSRVQVSDPRNFWNGDVIELFLDTTDDRRTKAFRPGHHTFWLVPLPEENRVYVGQWKRGEETDATRHDIPDIVSAARRTDSGYVAEVLIPRSQLREFNPTSGSTLGLNLNVTVVGQQQTREVYWARPKDSGILTDPTLWPNVRLVD